MQVADAHANAIVDDVTPLTFCVIGTAGVRCTRWLCVLYRTIRHHRKAYQADDTMPGWEMLAAAAAVDISM